MRRSWLAVSLLIPALASVPATAQAPPPTADQIIARYVQKVGGIDRIHAVHTLRRSGTFYGGGGFEAKVVELNKRPDMVRQEFTFGGLTGITAWDGKTGWKIEPWEGKKDPEALGEEEMKSILEDADLDGPLVDYAQKGNKVEYVGMDEVDGDPAYKLRVTRKTGDVEYWYIDTGYDVPLKIEKKRMVRGAEREYETTLGDYKQVDGWYLPFSTESGPKGSSFKQRIVIESITANVPMPDDIFARPTVGSAAPAQLQGQPSDASMRAAKPAGEMPAAGAAPAEANAPSSQTPSMEAPVVPAAASGPVKIDSDTISGLGARNIGSATMSGRIAAIAAVHEGNRLTVYVGTASGGVWKSVNGGTTYKPVFDKQPVQSIGALAIDPRNPKVVWAGSGEAWTRNSVSFGDGVYKSVDGGDNWTNVGLPESERIAKIAIDPTATDTVYVCVPGKLWSDSMDRGVYKTTDGGKTWSKVLAGGNASTGCSMLSMDPKNPKTLYAGLWDFRRKGWTFRSGGDGPNAPSDSGLFKSTDGGATWQSLDEHTATGLPSKPWGRIAVTVAPSDPNVVYALIEAEPPKNALYRSADGGKTWEKRDRSQFMIWRPFYFANLIVDPNDANKVYKPGGSLIASTDGGKSFSDVSGGAHGDFHDVWVDPQNSDHLITGDDGGIWYSYDAANKWWKAENLPVSQFYHVSVDMARPYHVYGGLQDNASWVGDSQFPGGITNDRWQNMFFGDGFWMFPDPTDADYVYAESQGGFLGRVNMKTHEIRLLQPLPGYKEGKLRFNWNTPLHVGKSGALYIGAQYLFRTKDQGQTWERISPDLTTNDPAKQRQEQSGGVTVDNSAAEMHTTIYAISESPKNANVIWVGTDDGNLQITRDGGKSWSNVVANVPGLPKASWVSYVDASALDEGTAFATFDRHTFGDMKPYAFVTRDFGKTWQSVIAADAPVRGYAHVLRQDLVNPNLFFLGTEQGLWISLDAGKQWAQYKGGDLPNVAVRDLVVHPRDNDLVIATHGRGIWIVDDITPLRALTPEVLAKEATFLPGNPVVQALPAQAGWNNGDAQYTGPNPSDDAVITYYQRRRHVFGDLAITVKDASGKVVGVVPSSKRRGLNRVTWPMREPAPKSPPAATGGVNIGPRMLPGTYTVTMVKDKATYTTPLEVVMDPRATYTLADRKADYDLAMDIVGQFADMTYTVEKINAVRAALDQRAAALPANDALAKRLRTASAQADDLRKQIVATKEGGMITGEERLREHLTNLYYGVVFSEGRPAQTQVENAAAIERELSDVETGFDTWAKKELPGINAELQKRKLEPIQPMTREAWQSSSAASASGGGGGADTEQHERRGHELERE